MGLRSFRASAKVNLKIFLVWASVHFRASERPHTSNYRYNMFCGWLIEKHNAEFTNKLAISKRNLKFVLLLYVATLMSSYSSRILPKLLHCLTVLPLYGRRTCQRMTHDPWASRSPRMSTQTLLTTSSTSQKSKAQTTTTDMLHAFVAQRA